MRCLITQMLAAAPVLTDGAWGTQLQARGLALGEFPDAWNLTHPAQVEAVAKSYVDAGSAVILTNTFGSNRIRLQEAGLADRLEAINRAGVQISRRAAGSTAKVFASIGPLGKMLFAGEVDAKTAGAAFAEQAHALADAGAHGLVIETMSDLVEARLAVQEAAKTGLPVVACMVFDAGKQMDRTMTGVDPERAAAALAEAGADVVGANCGQGIAGFVSICRRLKAASDRPVWVKANAGLPQISGGNAIYKTTAAEFASHAGALKEAGAGFIGGCCGTTPEFIAALKEALRQRAAPFELIP